MKTKLILLWCTGLWFIGCSDSELDTIDQNPNLVREVPLSAQLPNVIIAYNQQIVGGDAAIMAGYASEGNAYALGINPYDAFPLFNFEAWNNGYLLLTDLAVMKSQAIEEEAWAYAGIADLFKVLTVSNLTDLYGAIPYSEALDPNINAPNFDSPEIIYADLFTILNTASENLRRPVGNIAPENDDFIFNGNIGLWQKTVEALRARLLMRLVNVQADNAETALDAIDNAFMSGDEDFTLGIYTDIIQNANPLATPEIIQPRTSVGTGIISVMETFTGDGNLANDPRAALWFTVPLAATDGFVPAPNGTAMEDFQNPMGDLYSKPIFLQSASAPFPMLTFTEQLFIKAEAEFRLGNRQQAYATYLEAIRTALNKATGFDTDAAPIDQGMMDAYIASPGVAIGAENLTMDAIIGQKLIYLYQFQTIEMYNDIRRTGVLEATNPKGRANQFTYPDSELNRNPNVPTSVTALSIFDDGTKLFWAN